MKLTLMRLLHVTPGLRPVSRRIHPLWFFRLAHCSVALAGFFWPHARKLACPFRQVVGGHFDKKELRARSRRHLLYLRLFKDLECAWSNWETRPDWLSVEGEEHLMAALQAGKGAVLLSCHNFGFSKLVAPALAQRGYHVHRAGGGKKGGRRVSRWGKDYRINWKYLDHRGDYWHRLQSLAAVRAALAPIKSCIFRRGRMIAVKKKRPCSFLAENTSSTHAGFAFFKCCRRRYCLALQSPAAAAR